MSTYLEYGLTVHFMSIQTVQPNCHIDWGFYALQMDMEGFGNRLKNARVKAGLSGRELGVGLGHPSGDASRQTINDWEAERHWPNVVQLYRICKKLKVTPDFMLTGVDMAVQIEAARNALAALSMTAESGGKVLGGSPGATEKHDPRHANG